MTRLMLLAASISVLSACATPAQSAQVKAESAMAATTQEIPSEGLPAQKLEAGECGLFLWGMSAPRRFVFFSEAASGGALVLHEGKPVPLNIVGADGDVFGQFHTESIFRNSDGTFNVNLSFTPGELLEGGQRIASGRLVMKGADGWETVLPVTGASACMPG